jgi:hypothetical protein
MKQALRQELVLYPQRRLQCLATALFIGRQDHLLHDLDAVFAKEHVLGTAQAPNLRAAIASRGVLQKGTQGMPLKLLNWASRPKVKVNQPG